MPVTDRDSTAGTPKRWREYPEGTVLFDPVTWQTHCLSPDSLTVLDAVREILDGGTRAREAILDELVRQSGAPPATVADARDNLRPWVDLALHLYPAR